VIRRVGVIGAGTMGAGIAAHAANAGADVVLLDVVPGAAAKAVAAMARADPPPLMHSRFARRIAPADLPGGLAMLGDCDWIVEAIVENASAKRALYAAIDEVAKPDAILSSNTSTIPLAVLTDGMKPARAGRFLITHFFNPPRYMRLLEVVAGPTAQQGVVAAVRDFADRAMGKTVVGCRDTPGFIANRIGTLWIASALRHAVELGLTVEEADAAMGKPLGIPRTGVFGLLDLVGIDLGPHVAASLMANLPANDLYRAIHRDEEIVTRLIASGRTGRKAGAGFYRRQKGTREAVDLVSGEYRTRATSRLESAEARTASDLLAHPDRGGQYARAVMLDVLSYAASLVPEIAEGVEDVDAAMRLGYAWRWGPFELADRIGATTVSAMLKEAGRDVPPLLARAAAAGGFYRVEAGLRLALAPDGTWRRLARPEGVIVLEDIKHASTPLLKNGSAALWDIGDGVSCFEIATKMNALDADVMALLGRTIELGAAGGFKALVVYNEGEQFSVGANLGQALSAASAALWDEIEKLVVAGQSAYSALRAAPFPSVGAPAGMALGGGCEILLHCSAIQAHAELYMGLVEVGVGVIPGWGGCAAMLRRWKSAKALPKGPMPAVVKTFEQIATAQVSKSAEEAREMMFLRPIDKNGGDGITMNRDRLLADAKARALAMVDGYQPPVLAPLRLPGASGRGALRLAVEAQMRMGRATAHDAVVARHLAYALTGGERDHTEDIDDAAIHALERQGFMALLREPATLARIEHMLDTGRPLRN
jgi:3-hydroxyacyl-CoA dehydrogenase